MQSIICSDGCFRIGLEAIKWNCVNPGTLLQAAPVAGKRKVERINNGYCINLPPGTFNI